MKNKVGDINVNYSEFAYFSKLSENDQLNYFFQLFEGGVVKTGLDLKEFFSQLDSDNTNLNDTTNSYTYDSGDISDSDNLVDIMIDNEFIVYSYYKVHGLGIHVVPRPRIRKNV